jgi:hypothetical protein
MYQSILQFIEKDINKIEEVVKLLLRGEKDADHLSQEIHDRVINLATSLTAEIYEKLDEEIRESLIRKEKYTVEQCRQPKEILGISGTIRFNRTGYKNKSSGEYVYLLDRILGFTSHQRITIGAAAKILEETVLTSYRKGGKAASPYDAASKQAVKRLVHGTVVDFPVPDLKEKKKLKTLYIVADEDHVAAQFMVKKGDLKKDKRGNTINTLIPKLICIYEGIENESGEKSKTPRYRLIGKRYFSGIYNGEAENLRLWEEVGDYIYRTYDASCLERIYIMGDGAAWIKGGLEVLENSRFVLDKYHLMKYINTSVTHLLDSADEVKSEIWRCINGAHRKELKDIYAKILSVTESENKMKEVSDALNYFLNNWAGIKIRRSESARLKCCAEGQVSHVLSSRMSSRPMGWSELGCDQMAKFRAFSYNGGKIIDLLRYQKSKQDDALVKREDAELIRSLRQRKSGWDYEETMSHSIPGLSQHSFKWMKDLINHAVNS